MTLPLDLDLTKPLENYQLLATWRRYFEQRFGRGLPEDYAGFDLETTGFAKEDLIWSIGHCIVNDRQVVHRGQLILDWTRSPHVDQDWLHEKIARIRRVMAENFKPCALTYELMRDQGVKPEKALTHYHTLLTALRANGNYFVGANLYNFDNRMFRDQLEEFTGLAWEFAHDEAIDVGALEKARQCDLPPFYDETLKKYFGRVNANRKLGVRWNVEHCIATYGLHGKYGIDMTQCHGAEYDAYVTHLIFEEQRALGELV